MPAFKTKFLFSRNLFSGLEATIPDLHICRAAQRGGRKLTIDEMHKIAAQGWAKAK